MTTRTLMFAVAAFATIELLAPAAAEAQYRRGRQHYSPRAPEQTISYMVGYAVLDDGLSVDSLARPAPNSRTSTPPS